MNDKLTFLEKEKNEVKKNEIKKKDNSVYYQKTIF